MATANRVSMTGLQLIGSVLLSFLFPGLGQLYQAKFSPERAVPAFWLVLATVLCCYSLVGLFVVWIVYIVSIIEVLAWVMGQNTIPAPGRFTSVAFAALMVALLAGGRMAQADDPALPSAFNKVKVTEDFPEPNIENSVPEKSVYNSFKYPVVPVIAYVEPETDAQPNFKPGVIPEDIAKKCVCGCKDCGRARCHKTPCCRKCTCGRNRSETAEQPTYQNASCADGGCSGSSCANGSSCAMGQCAGQGSGSYRVRYRESYSGYTYGSGCNGASCRMRQAGGWNDGGGQGGGCQSGGYSSRGRFCMRGRYR